MEEFEFRYYEADSEGRPVPRIFRVQARSREEALMLFVARINGEL